MIFRIICNLLFISYFFKQVLNLGVKTVVAAWLFAVG